MSFDHIWFLPNTVDDAGDQDFPNPPLEVIFRHEILDEYIFFCEWFGWFGWFFGRFGWFFQ